VPILSVIKASAMRRLGKPLLLTYAGLAIFGVLVVVLSIVAMRFG
jgi:hypothetical protein